MSKLKRLMRLGLVLGGTGWHQADWRHPVVPADGDMDFEHLRRCAQVSEQGKLDFIFLRDVAAVPNLSHPRMGRHREQGHVKLEALALAAALAAVTHRIGLVPTASTSLSHPFALARRLASIDHLSQGRAGWNLVTSATPDENRNYSLDGVLDSARRYERAREFLAVVQGLFDGWEPGAFLRDRASGVYMDPAKMHRLHHAGPHFTVRGPSDVDRPPQGALPIITDGTSDADQDLAAEVADVVFGGQPGIEGARALYSSIKARVEYYGRTSESLHVMPCIMPMVGHTQAEAEDRFAALQDRLHPEIVDATVKGDHYPEHRGDGPDAPVPDAPVPDAVSRGAVHFGIVGTPTLIANTMEEWFATGAADGFIIQPPYLPGGIEDFVRMVVPELQRRDLFRLEYEGATLRENLGRTPFAAWKSYQLRSARHPTI
jgi:FMN-dependent oxidoreductase (nitrilotriacetate monooxygenase family)